MTKFEHIISIGSFCSPALEIERIGLRDASYPFDWLISDFKGVIDCIESEFYGFLEFDNILQYSLHPEYYFDKKYKFHFYHDFSANIALSDQLPLVREKYNRRIERFKQNIQQPTLFIRYVANQEEIDYIETNFVEILALLKNKNENNELLLISNENIKSEVLNLFKVEKDVNDFVARKFLEKNKELKDLLCSSDIYDENKRKMNIDKYIKKQQKKNKILRLPLVVKHKIEKMIKKPYIHTNILNE